MVELHKLFTIQWCIVIARKLLLRFNIGQVQRIKILKSKLNQSLIGTKTKRVYQSEKA